MDLQKLERMIAIYEAGSFRKAAKQLGMAQPTLTWSMQQLEESLNVRLFERGPRGIRPTELCERLVQRARLIFREQDRLLGDVEAASRSQIINIGVHSIFLSPEFARCITEFSEKWPSVTLRIREGFSSDLVERLLRGELDFACCALPAETAESASLDMVAHAPLNYSVVARPGHPIFADIAAGRPVAPYCWVEFDTVQMGAFPGDNDMQALLDKVGLSIGQRSVRTTSMNLIRLLLLEGDFIGLIADEPVARDLGEGRLRRVPGTQVNASQFGFVGLKDDLETKAVQALKALLAAKAFEPLKRLL
ncbi:MAG TPA: LysR family transcriptional regulator [Sphingobium sp.]